MVIVINKIYVSELGMDKITIIDYNGESKTFSMGDIVRVDETNYQQEFIAQPAKYTYFANVLQSAKRVQAEQEDLLAKLHGELYNKAYNQLKDDGIKPTKDLIEAQIEQDDAYYKAKQRLAAAVESVGRANYLVKALEQRAQMLQSYGADQRKDFKYGN